MTEDDKTQFEAMMGKLLTDRLKDVATKKDFAEALKTFVSKEHLRSELQKLKDATQHQDFRPKTFLLWFVIILIFCVLIGVVSSILGVGPWGALSGVLPGFGIGSTVGFWRSTVILKDKTPMTGYESEMGRI